MVTVRHSSTVPQPTATTFASLPSLSSSFGLGALAVRCYLPHNVKLHLRCCLPQRLSPTLKSWRVRKIPAIFSWAKTQVDWNLQPSCSVLKYRLCKRVRQSCPPINPTNTLLVILLKKACTSATIVLLLLFSYGRNF